MTVVPVVARELHADVAWRETINPNAANLRSSAFTLFANDIRE
jgi:hypothetical protein